MIFTKPAQAPTKTKKNKTFVIYRPPALSRCSEFCFFCFFLMPVQVLCIWWFVFFVFFDACAGFVTLTFTKHAQASKKTKNTKHDLHKTCTGTNKNKKNKTFVIYRPPALSRCSEFCFFVFFDACAGFVHLVVCFFLFFLMPVQVLWL